MATMSPSCARTCSQPVLRLNSPKPTPAINSFANSSSSCGNAFPAAHFHIRLDAAGQYATNLEVFLRGLPVPLTLTVGEPARNQHYRKALFPKRKADPVESLCAARFALVEKPRPTAITPTAFYHLREIVARLEGQTRLSTRLTNQLHNLLARVFPELALIATNFQTSWVLRLLSRYPTPQHIVRAGQTRLTAIPYLTADKAAKILAAATTTVASFAGATAATLVRQLVAQLRHSRATEADLKALMTEAYQQLPLTNHLDSIPGIGIATAAVLTAKIVAIDRFATPAQLVGYFGIFAEENSSGIGKDGQAKQGRHCHMSRKGNDLARKYLWNAAKTAITHNPAIRALYQRLRTRGSRGDVALGHCMRKLLQLVFAVWTTGKPFDPQHYPWQALAEQAAADNKKTAGHNQDTSPARIVVTAADSTISPAPHQTRRRSACRAAPRRLSLPKVSILPRCGLRSAWNKCWPIWAGSTSSRVRDRSGAVRVPCTRPVMHASGPFRFTWAKRSFNVSTLPAAPKAMSWTSGPPRSACLCIRLLFTWRKRSTYPCRHRWEQRRGTRDGNPYEEPVANLYQRSR